MCSSLVITIQYKFSSRQSCLVSVGWLYLTLMLLFQIVRVASCLEHGPHSSCNSQFHTLASLATGLSEPHSGPGAVPALVPQPSSEQQALPLPRLTPDAHPGGRSYTLPAQSRTALAKLYTPHVSILARETLAICNII